MTRRCKAGQRARIIARSNRGKIVVVVRHYFGEDLDGTWPEAAFPWVVTSLGAPLRNFKIPSGIENAPKMTIVVCDTNLEPLDDDYELLAGIFGPLDEEVPTCWSEPMPSVPCLSEAGRIGIRMPLLNPSKRVHLRAA